MCLSFKGFRTFGLLPKFTKFRRGGCTFQDLTYRTPDESRMDATVNYEAEMEFNLDWAAVFCLTALHLGHPKSLVRLHVFRPLRCSMEGLFGVGHSIQAAIITTMSMLWDCFCSLLLVLLRNIKVWGLCCWKFFGVCIPPNNSALKSWI